MPLLSTRANASARGYGMFGGAAASTTAYESIQTVSLSGTQATISFTSIPSTYKNLQIRGISRSSTTYTYQSVVMVQFNSDATAGNYYAYHLMTGDTTAAASYAGATTTTAGGMVGRTAGGSGVANTFAPLVIDILDYADTNKYKTTRAFSGNEGQTTNIDNDVTIFSNLWKSTSAISQIDLKVNGGFSFVQYSHFALYGIKG